MTTAELRADTEGMTGVILLRPSGVVWTAQTGGYACHHPEAEGVLIPLLQGGFVAAMRRHFVDDEGPYGGWCDDAITPATADWLDGIFTTRNIPIVVDRDRLTDDQESWIYVRTLASDAPMTWPAGLSGVLTWENSD